MGYVIEKKNEKYNVVLSLIKDGYSLYQIEIILEKFNKNGISIHETLKFLYENSMPKLKEVKENCRVIFKNKDGSISILKPLATYTKDNDSYTSLICSVCGINNCINVVSAKDIKSLYKTICIAKRENITTSLRRFCKRIKVSIFVKEDLSEEAKRSLRNINNIIKYKKLIKIKDSEFKKYLKEENNGRNC